MLRTALKFGAFTLVCLLFTTYLAFTIGNIDTSDPLGRNYYKLSASFDDVSGLLPDDNVKVAGVVIGKVLTIKAEKGRANVSFEVKDGYKLPDDSNVQIRWRNLIGQRYLYVNPGRSTTAFRGGEHIDASCTGTLTTRCTTSVVDLGQLFNRLGPLVAAIDENQVNAFLDTITQALQGNTSKLNKAIDDLAVLAKALGQRDQTIGRLITNLDTVTGTIANRDQQIRVMLDNLVLISQTFSANTDVLDQALTESSRFSANLRSVLDGNAAELDRIISNLALVSTETISPRLQTLDSALQNLDVAASKIFLASSLGEWLNEDILCAGVEPPTAGLPGNCTGLGPVVGGSGSVAGGSTSAPASSASIGSGAPSVGAGSNLLAELIRGRAS